MLKKVRKARLSFSFKAMMTKISIWRSYQNQVWKAKEIFLFKVLGPFYLASELSGAYLSARPEKVFGGVSSVGRASAWHAEGQRFESATLHHFLLC